MYIIIKLRSLKSNFYNFKQWGFNWFIRGEGENHVAEYYINKIFNNNE